MKQLPLFVEDHFELVHQRLKRSYIGALSFTDASVLVPFTELYKPPKLSPLWQSGFPVVVVKDS